MSNQNVAMTAINSRVWYVVGGVHPSSAPEMLALGKFSADPSHSIGEATKITAPDPNSFGKDVQVGIVEGSEERASLSIGIRTTAQASELLRWKNLGCRVDVYALMGKCGNPQDFTEGGEKWVYFPDGRVSGHSYENFGSFGRDENNPMNESVDMTAETYYEFLVMKEDQKSSSSTVREIYAVDVYRGSNCSDDCADPCDKVLAAMAGASATPGTQPSILYSSNGGETFTAQTITSMFSNEEVADGEVIGGDIVYISPTSNSIHWTSIDQLYNGTNVWEEVISGFVAAKAPRAISSADARHTWIVGDGGYVYFAKSHKTGVEVQDAGVATTQNLNAVSAYDAQNVMAVGNSNAVIYTTTGGTSWASVTGPVVGVNLGACWMWSESVWFVGEGAGGTGKLWLTVNSGLTWSQVDLPANYLRIYKIKFISEAEGYISAQSGSQSYVLRTITAGNEWVVLPQGKSGVAVDNSYLRDIAVCSKSGNTAFAAGLAANGTAGIIVKAAA